MQSHRELAAWLISRRQQIELAVAASLGTASPRPASAEAEALRRFRSFTSTALVRGDDATPSLEGLRPNERRLAALLDAWKNAAVELADGRFGADLGKQLDPLIERFRLAVRSTGPGRRARGAPRAARRAVAAAIDRVCDAFLAIDTNSGEIVDANPAAGALFGVTRDALLGLPVMGFVPSEAQAGWWTQFDALSEGDDNRQFSGGMLDTRGKPLEVEASITRFATRGRTLALVLMRGRPRAVSSIEAKSDQGAAGVAPPPGASRPGASRPGASRPGASR